MSVVIITGSAGLVGSEAVSYFAGQGHHIVGIDNDMRRRFFGDDASTHKNQVRLCREFPEYSHHDVDIRDADAIDAIFRRYGSSISLVIHTAAQPSHDWAAGDPLTDFSVNATGTQTILEATRRFAPDAVFIFTSTNKVYGDQPNHLPYIEQASRWELTREHPYSGGIPESMSIDQCLHSVFGASKVAADILVQEYGRYFGMRTASFRGGCLTGPNHAGTQLHGFLSYLVRCTLTGASYTVFGYKGKQVRDNIHSHDLVRAFDAVYRNPRSGEVYNIGGGRQSNCSMLEAIDVAQDITGRELNWTYQDGNRIGDHIWWVSDLSRFKAHYPEWDVSYDIPGIIQEIAEAGRERWLPGKALAS
jgi:CDP-paratose 2-epimerase